MGEVVQVNGGQKEGGTGIGLAQEGVALAEVSSTQPPS